MRFGAASLLVLSACRTTGPGGLDRALREGLDGPADPELVASEAAAMADRIDPGPQPPLSEVLPPLFRVDVSGLSGDPLDLMREDVAELRDILDRSAFVHRIREVGFRGGRTVALAEATDDAEARALGIQMYGLLVEFRDLVRSSRWVWRAYERNDPAFREVLDRVVALRPTLVARLERLGAALLRASPDHPDAADFLVRFAGLRRETDLARSLRAAGLAARLQPEARFEALRAIVESYQVALDPDRAEPWVDRAESAASLHLDAETLAEAKTTLRDQQAHLEAMLANGPERETFESYHALVDGDLEALRWSAVEHIERRFPDDARTYSGRASAAFYGGRLEDFRRSLDRASALSSKDERYWALEVTERLTQRIIPPAMAAFGGDSEARRRVQSELAALEAHLEGLASFRPADAALSSAIVRSMLGYLSASAPEGEASPPFSSAALQRALDALALEVLNLRAQRPDHAPTQIIFSMLSVASTRRDLALSALTPPPDGVLATEGELALWRRAAMLVALRWEAWDALDAIAATFPAGAPRSWAELDDVTFLERIWVSSGHPEHSWAGITDMMLDYFRAHAEEDLNLRISNNLGVAAFRAGRHDIAKALFTEALKGRNIQTLVNRARVSPVETWRDDLFSIPVEEGGDHALLVYALRAEHATDDAQRAEALRRIEALGASDDFDPGGSQGALRRLCILEGPSMTVSVGYEAGTGLVIRGDLTLPAWWLLPPCAPGPLED